MSLSVILIYLASASLVIGAVFAIVGAVGLVKFNDVMTRMHAPTKVGTLGIGALLLASMLVSFATRGGSVHEVLIMAFLFVTAPVSAKFIAKVHIHKQSCVSPPKPPRDDMWSTQNTPEQDRDIEEMKEA